MKTEPTITTKDIQTTVGGTITLMATVSYGNKIILGKVGFKINGYAIYTNILNNTAKKEFTLDESFKAGTYLIRAILLCDDYDEVEDIKTLTVTNN